MGKLNLFHDLMPSLRRANQATLSLTRHLFGSESESIESLCELIMKSDGEYSSLVIAERILAAYQQLNDDQRIEFFNILAEHYDLDCDHLQQRLDSYREYKDSKNFTALNQVAESRRQELFRRLNMAPGGTVQLVKMREHLLQHVKEFPHFARIDVDFRHLFNSWFNRGFLLLQPIDWTTPAHILEKIIAYEAVHEIHSWSELRHRLEPRDRHCFAFFHPAMEEEPLVFVEVALANSMPDRIDQILNNERQLIDPEGASHAIFYSISSCHRGLSSISFGNFLIKQVATSLQLQFPQLKHFATLSPAPGFRRWLSQQADQDERLQPLFEIDRNRLDQGLENDNGLEGLRDTLYHYAAMYYLKAKTPGNEPVDPVARFHLKNGASLDRLNPWSDLSAKGIEQSLGLMVNYVYDLARVEHNHEDYMLHQRIVCSSQIKKLAD